MSKAQKRKLMGEDKANRKKFKSPCMDKPAKLPFTTASSDHCETSPEAYAHIVPLLRLISRRLGKEEGALQIYDPYYCSGAVKRHLAALGFPSVYNECEDFYERLASGSTPEHDVVVSNPPYSEDPGGGSNHVARLLRFCVEGGRPFLLNMPEYVASSAYYGPSFADGEAPLLLAPLFRYHFWTPPKLRKDVNKKAHRNPELGIRCSPFVSLWYVSLAPVLSSSSLLKRAARGRLPGIEAAGGEAAAAPERAAGAPETSAEAAAAEVPVECRLCRSLEELPASRSAFKKKPKGEGAGTTETAARPRKKKRRRSGRQGGGAAGGANGERAKEDAGKGRAAAATLARPAKKGTKRSREVAEVSGQPVGKSRRGKVAAGVDDHLAGRKE